jgi:hypothetical protein
MNKYYLAFMTALSCAMVLLSCAEQKREASLDDTLSMYEQAIRWSAFDKAANYLKKPEQADIPKLDSIKVTSYQPMGRDVADNGQRIEEKVRIHFLFQHNQKQRSLIDHQVWEYDATENRWYLMTSLPNFTAASHRGYGR